MSCIEQPLRITQQKIANEHRAQENRVPRYLADLQNGIHGLKKLLLTISMNLSQKKIQTMISHQQQNVDVAMDVVDEVAGEDERINIKQTSHPK